MKITEVTLIYSYNPFNKALSQEEEKIEKISKNLFSKNEFTKLESETVESS